MGTLWCAGLPIVTVPRCDTPKPVTLVMPYYENPQFLRQQVNGWASLPDDLVRRLAVIVVDDGSPVTPASDGLKNSAFPVRLFRIGVDVRWNWLAARNIGMHHAADGWCVLTDMDHVITAETLRSVLYGVHDPDVIYAFSRAEHTGERVTPHSASFLMTREMFWKVGGYDERLSGYYGTDGTWRRRCAAVAPMQVLSDVLIRYEYVSDSSTTRYKRKQPEDAAVKRLIAGFPKGSRPTHLTFPYHEVTV